MSEYVGENLSPLLFALHLNDFTKYMSQWYKGLQLFSNECYSQTNDDDKNKNDKNNKNVEEVEEECMFGFPQMIRLYWQRLLWDYRLH